MADSVQERKIQAAVLKLKSLGLFARVGRGKPIAQSIPGESRPAAFIVRLDADRVTPAQPETDVQWLRFGVLIFGKETDFEKQDAELVLLEAEVYRLLENQNLGDLGFNAHWFHTYSPQVNQNMPLDSTMPAFETKLGHSRGNPFE